MALGADSGRVIATVLADRMRPVIAGIAAGLTGALVLAYLLRSVLFEVTPHDPAMFASAAAVLVAIAAVACFLPAKRAARLDPLAALREE